MDNYSALGGLLWIIPLVFLASTIYCTYRMFKVRKGGVVWWEPDGTRRFSSDKPKYTTIPSFWVAIFSFTLLITSLIVMYADK